MKLLTRYGVVCLVIVLLSSTFIAHVSAVSGSITFEKPHPDSTCNSSSIELDISVTGTVADTGPSDVFTLIVRDGAGNILFIVVGGLTVGSTLNTTYFVSMNNLAVRPVTATLYDLSSTPVDLDAAVAAADTSPVIASSTFDPADVFPVCASLPLASPSASTCLSIPSGSVVGALPNATRAYYSPGNVSSVTVNAGSYWVLGVDSTGAYYKILLACQYLWLPVESMQPSDLPPQNGAPLPTQVVS